MPTHNERIQFNCDRANKTFTDAHGDCTAGAVQCLCGVADDAPGLLDVHGLIVKDFSLQESLLSPGG